MMEDSKFSSASLFKALSDYESVVQDLVECRTKMKSEILELHERTIQHKLGITKNLHVSNEEISDSVETSCSSIRKLLREIEANDLNSITNNTGNNLELKRTRINNDIGLIKNIFNKLQKEVDSK